MTSEQYWQWFWWHVYYSMFFVVPGLIVCAIWAIASYYQEMHEDDAPKQHFTELKLR